MNIIEVKDVYKSFKLPHEQHNGVKQKLINALKGKKGYEEQKVLKGISFEVKKGEFFGIVGRNGSGKSTLLKILAGIYAVDSGSIEVRGLLTPFIELGVGFNPELTGRENVYLNGALLGFSRKDMDGMYDEIVDFAEIHKFMDQKLKNYSSGMQVRLAFSIAIRANTPILLIDEVLAVGDSKFQNKCYAEFRKMKQDSRTIILVTHDMSAVERFCDRALVLKEGEIQGIYKPNEAAVEYERMNATTDNKKILKSGGKRWGTNEIKLESISIDSKKLENNVVYQGQDLRLKLNLSKTVKPKRVTIGLAFHDMFGVNMSGPNSDDFLFDNSGDITFTIPKLAFLPGEYIVTVVIFNENSEIEYDHIEEALKFTVLSDKLPQYGKVNLFGVWEQ